jgi:glutamate-5-semialdehyde dehydrogenase
MPELLTATKYVDILIPRGSQQLIDYVREHASVPVIETGAGVCHTYVEASANLENAANIVTNAKVTRPSVCNSLDTVIADREILEPLLKLLAPKLEAYQVEIFADPESYLILKGLEYPYLKEAVEEDFGREFLDFKCSVKTVDNFDEAVKHIRKFSSKHSEAIVSSNYGILRAFSERSRCCGCLYQCFYPVYGWRCFWSRSRDWYFYTKTACPRSFCFGETGDGEMDCKGEWTG